MAETVLVTGGSGFVAGWCIVELLKHGYRVRTSVRSLAKEQTVRATLSSAIDPGEQLTFYAADLTADDGWDAAVGGCDYVLHVASPLGTDNREDPNALIIPAREGALRVLHAATRAGVKRLVMTSACAAASKVPTRTVPDFVLRVLARFDPELQSIMPGLGRKNRHTAEKAQRLLAWHPRPAAETIVACAESLNTWNVI